MWWLLCPDRVFSRHRFFIISLKLPVPGVGMPFAFIREQNKDGGVLCGVPS